MVAPDPGDREGDLELGEQRAEHVPDARLPSERQAVHVRAADEDGLGPQGQRPVDVGPRADARAEQDGDLAADRVRDPRQDVDRPNRAGTAAAALADTDDIWIIVVTIVAIVLIAAVIVVDIMRVIGDDDSGDG